MVRRRFEDAQERDLGGHVTRQIPLHRYHGFASEFFAKTREPQLHIIRSLLRSTPPQLRLGAHAFPPAGRVSQVVCHHHRFARSKVASKEEWMLNENSTPRAAPSNDRNNKHQGIRDGKPQARSRAEQREHHQIRGP